MTIYGPIFVPAIVAPVFILGKPKPFAAQSRRQCRHGCCQKLAVIIVDAPGIEIDMDQKEVN